MVHVKRLLGLLAFVFSLALPAAAQVTPTVVSGTITDTNGIPYANAQIQITLVTAGGQVPSTTPCTQPFGCQIQDPNPTVTATTAGTYIVNLYPNTSILPNTPTQSTYTFLISVNSPPPLGTGPQICKQTGVTITGATQTLNFSACPALSSFSSIATNSLGAAVNVKNAPYNAFGDTKYLTGITLSRTASNLTMPAGYTPSSADIGKSIQCISASFGGEVVPYPTNNSGQTLPATITGVAGQVVSYNTLPVGSGTALTDGICIWGHNDTAAATNAFNSCKTASVNGQFGTVFVLTYPCVVYFPVGGYMIEGTAFNGLVTSGNEMGVSMIGDGPNMSLFWPTVGFVNSSPANCGWFICGYGYGQQYKNFAIELNMSFNTGTEFGFSNEDVIKLNCGHCLVEDVHEENYGSSTSSFMIDDAGGAELHYTRLENGLGLGSGFVCNSCATDVYYPFFSNTHQNLAISNVAGRGSGNYFTSHGGVVDEGSITSVTASKTVSFFGTTLMGGTNCLSVDATSEVKLSGGYCGTFNGNPGGGGPTVASGGVLWLGDVEVSANGSSSYCFNAAAVGGILDMGNNQCILAGSATIYASGSVHTQFNLVTGAITQLGGRQLVSSNVNPTVVPAGFGTGGTCTVQTNSTDAAGAVICTAGTAAGSSGTIQLQFTTVDGGLGTNPPICTWNLQNGTGTWSTLAQEPVLSSITTTGVIANWANNAIGLTSGDTYGFNWSCYGH